MPWPWQSGSSSSPAPKKDEESSSSSLLPDLTTVFSKPPAVKKPVSWNDSLHATDWTLFREPSNWVPTLLVTSTLFVALHVYKSYLRRIPDVNYIQPRFFRNRSLFGRVTSVGDGDNFRFFHTPGGRWAGWGWVRKVPIDKKVLKDRTVHVRLAGIDAPEGAHFGRPAQPYSSEALQWLQSYLLHRPVRAYIYRRDQYERVVATVYVRRFLFFRKDIGLEMLRMGLATTYEAKTGAEYGGEKLEKKYRDAEAEAKRQRLGMWGALGGKPTSWVGSVFGRKTKDTFESPREYKTRMKAGDDAEKGQSKKM